MRRSAGGAGGRQGGDRLGSKLRMHSPEPVGFNVQPPICADQAHGKAGRAMRATCGKHGHAALGQRAVRSEVGSARQMPPPRRAGTAQDRGGAAHRRRRLAVEAHRPAWFFLPSQLESFTRFSRFSRNYTLFRTQENYLTLQPHIIHLPPLPPSTRRRHLRHQDERARALPAPGVFVV